MTGKPLRVQVESAEDVAVVRFANPPHGTISNGGAADLVAAIRPLLAAAETRAIILAGGQDGIFIRHADVRQIATSLERVGMGSVDPQAFATSAFAELGAMLDAAEKPVIAAIDGLCMGGGFEIALACTMRIASPAATAIGLPEIRLDIFPGGGGTQRLSRLVGRHRARLFMLRGDVMTASQALAAGLVDEVVPCALDRALELAGMFAGRSTAAVSAILRLTATDEDRERLAAEACRFGELGLTGEALPEALFQFAEGDVGLETMR